jgi:endonuclease YncB( thermonuclease family)
MNLIIKLNAFILFFVLIVLSSYAIEWSGKCVGVTDGDTISVMHNGVAEKIRLGACRGTPIS